MNTKHIIAAITATLLSAASAFAADTPVAAPAKPADSKPVLLASAATTATAAGVAATAVVAAKPATRTRAEVHAEAVEAVRHHLSTQSQQYDLLK